jgi:hypothetical protein
MIYFIVLAAALCNLRVLAQRQVRLEVLDNDARDVTVNGNVFSCPAHEMGRGHEPVCIV